MKPQLCGLILDLLHHYRIRSYDVQPVWWLMVPQPIVIILMDGYSYPFIWQGMFTSALPAASTISKVNAQSLNWGLLMIGVVIHDLVLLERVLKSSTATRALAGERMERIKEKYHAAGLPLNVKKKFLDATTARFWGAEVDGEKGIVRASSFRIWPLMLITVRVCCLGVSSISLLGGLLDICADVQTKDSLCGQRALRCFALHASNDIVRLSVGLADELLAMVVLGTLAYVNSRAEFLPTFRAVDASGWGSAAVSADLAVPVAKEAWRFSLGTSLWTKLLPPGEPWLKQKGLLASTEDLPDDEGYDTHPFWTLLARYVIGLVFRTEWRRAHYREVHINVSELGAHLREEKLLCSLHQSFRCIYGCQGQVALGALVKGRSPSKSFNCSVVLALCWELMPTAGVAFCFRLWPSWRSNSRPRCWGAWCFSSGMVAGALWRKCCWFWQLACAICRWVACC